MEEFAKIFVQQVRDRSIRSCDSHLSSPNGLIGKRWHEFIKRNDPELLAETMIPDIVDETIFYLLNAIDQGILNITFELQGKVIDISKEATEDLGGSYLPVGGGWVETYSQERFYDYFSEIEY